MKSSKSNNSKPLSKDLEKSKEKTESVKSKPKNEKEAVINNISKLESNNNDSSYMNNLDQNNTKQEKIDVISEKIEKSEVKNKIENESIVNKTISKPKEQSNKDLLIELEDKVTNLERNLKEMNLKVGNTSEEKLKIKEEIETITISNNLIQEKFNERVITKVKNAFSKELDSASVKIVNLEKENDDLKRQIQLLTEDKKELKEILNLKERAIENLNEIIIKSNNDYSTMKDSYDDILRENEKQRMVIEQRDKVINDQKIELEEIKMVIGRLTEVRIILNKYFSSYFENFTPNEKRIINDVQNQLGNIEPEELGFQKENNVSQRKQENIRTNINKVNQTNTDYDNISINKQANKRSINNPYEDNNQKFNNINNQNKKNNLNDIPVDNSRFQSSQEQTNNNANKRISTINSQNQGINKSGGYNPDDDFWYENRRKK